MYETKEKAQSFLSNCVRSDLLRFFNYGIAVTRKREALNPSSKTVHPFLSLLAKNEGVHERIMLLLDPQHCRVEDR